MIPSAYLVKRDLSREALSIVLDAVLIHPVCCAVVFQYVDVELGRKLAENVALKTEPLAELLSRPCEEPLAFVVAQDEALIAVYSDGTREILI